MGDYTGGGNRSGRNLAPGELVPLAGKMWRRFIPEQGIEYMDKRYKAFTDDMPQTQWDALRSYSNRAFTGINGILRNTNQKYWRLQRDVYAGMIQELDAMFASPGARLKENLVVHRLVDGDYLQTLKAAPVGSVITDPGFLSTTIGIGRAGSVMIYAPTNTKAVWVKPMANMSDENELLLGRGTSLKVLERDQWGGLVFEVVGQE